MPIHYVQFSVSIHGLSTNEEGLDRLRSRMREMAKAELLGPQRSLYGFRDEFENDVDIELVETS